MNAILLAAGLGTRLRPLTDVVPKCLMSVGGRPLLEIWLENLKAIPIKKIVINTHYKSKIVENFLTKCPNISNVVVRHEPILLGTAGTLINNIKEFSNDELMVIHADNYCLADLNQLILAHKSRPVDCLMTMMLFNPKDPTLCGIVKTKDNVVIEFFEKNKIPVKGLANAAVYIFSKELLYLIDSEYRHISDISTELLPKLLGKIYTYYTNNTVIDIGSLDSYREANEFAFRFNQMSRSQDINQVKLND